MTDPHPLPIRPALSEDRSAWGDLRAALWPESPPGDHRREIDALLARPERWQTYLALAAGAPVGFVEVSLREDTETIERHPIGWIEGWYVAPDHRRRGVGRALLAAAEAWAFERGARVVGSDAEAANEVSLRAHAALGYRSLGAVVLLRKSLEPPAGGP